MSAARSGERPPGLKVLFIIGRGRSGSTILDNLLGQQEGYLSLGQVNGVWGKSLRGELCGCGEPLSKVEAAPETYRIGFSEGDEYACPRCKAGLLYILPFFGGGTWHWQLREPPFKYPAGWPRCPGCGELLVERHGYHIARQRIGADGCCPACRRPIPGIWA